MTKMTRWRTLVSATAAFNLSFLICLVVAAIVVPVVLLNAYVYRPHIAEGAHVDGFVDTTRGFTPGDD